MNLDNSGATCSGSSSVSNLINKLCLHMSKNNAEVSSNLFKLAINFLSSSSSGSRTTFNTTGDEQFVVAQIRKYLLATQNRESVEKFDLLYASFQKSSILNQKCAILTFLMSLVKDKTQKDLNKWTMLKELQPLQGRVDSIKSHLSVAPGPSQETIKIYSGMLAKKQSARSISAHTQASAATTIYWSPSESELLKSTSTRTTIPVPGHVTEEDLLQDLIYCFQGVEGKFLRKETDGFGFVLDPKTSKGISLRHRSLVERLSGVGFFHNQLKYFCDNTDKEEGTIAQALSATLREELSDHYRTVAVLQTQLKKQNCSEHSELTLRRMLVWVAEHNNRFQWLAYIAEECSNKKGGALISAVHSFLHHGAKIAQMVSRKVLTAVCRPLYLMLSRWLLDGELVDSYSEFFIEARSIHAAERLWHDKYHVRETMVPAFITMTEAKKILATGKSINFLRQICKDGDQLPGREAFQKLFSTTTAEVLFEPEHCIEFHSTLQSVYKETSYRVLELLKGKFRLLDHLQALRRYLLLGQGDFIRHLLELLAPELNKPAEELYGHTLTAILESAIRVTNAQFEDEDTLKRLNVGLMNHSVGDTGWDVFSLVYLVDGPVGTIFQPTMSTYKCLFGALWKAKRMEFVLSNMRKQQIGNGKLLRKIEELKPVTHLIYVLSSEMIHFLHQTQYYFLFEVLECSWAEMLGHVNQAESLDDIIVAHTKFLSSVKSGFLLDPQSADLCSLLRIIYNFILNLESVQESLYSAALKERDALTEYELKAECEDGFGIDLKIEREAEERRLKFNHFLNAAKEQVKQLAKQYNEFIQKYLNHLATSSNMNLQLLSVRLNFNDYYKIT